jgi:ferredoxin
MASREDKLDFNVDGKFYVDDGCIDCDLCRETAPDFFTRSDEEAYSYVHTQPTTQEDIDLCMEALEGCPVEAIGDDGDE